jgi:hypothetical protein
MRFNWGTAITLVYATFATCTAGFVVFAMQHPVELVSDDYYASSLKHDEKRTAIENASRLDRPVLSAIAGELAVALPPAQAGDARGELRLYRPSDQSADRTWPLAVAADGSQRISTAGVAAGYWVMQLSWTSGGRAFYLEQAVRIP